MRALHLADLHIRLTGPRAAECRRIIPWIGTRAHDVKPDLVTIAGDIYDHRSTPEERLFFRYFIANLAATCGTVAIVTGNHDDPDDVGLFADWIPGVHVITKPQVLTFDGVPVAFLPWPDLKGLTAALPASTSIANRRAAAREALIDVLRGFRPLLEGRESLLLAHIPIDGASMDSGQPVSGGEEIALTADELFESGAAGVMAGHIHLRQPMKTGDGRPCWYAGAPFRCNFGEAKGGKGGLIWTWSKPKALWKVEPWNTPAREMALVNAAFIDGVFNVDVFNAAPDAEIRLRIEFPADQRTAARERAAEWSAMIKGLNPGMDVTVDERPTASGRAARSAEIENARTTGEKLAAWGASTGQGIPDGARVKLAEIEKAAGHEN